MIHVFYRKKPKDDNICKSDAKQIRLSDKQTLKSINTYNIQYYIYIEVREKNFVDIQNFNNRRLKMAIRLDYRDTLLMILCLVVLGINITKNIVNMIRLSISYQEYNHKATKSLFQNGHADILV